MVEDAGINGCWEENYRIKYTNTLVLGVHRWRLLRRYRIETSIGEFLEIEVKEEKEGYRVKIIGEDREYRVRVLGFDEDLKQAILDINGNRIRIDGFQHGIVIDGVPAIIRKVIEFIPTGISGKEGGKKKTTVPLQKGLVVAPLSGKIIDIKVKEGDRVYVDTAVALIESMKMITEIKAGIDGIVEKIFVEKNKAVNKGQPIVKIKPEIEHGEKEKEEKEGKKEQKKKEKKKK